MTGLGGVVEGCVEAVVRHVHWETGDGPHYGGARGSGNKSGCGEGALGGGQREVGVEGRKGRRKMKETGGWHGLGEDKKKRRKRDVKKI